MRKLVIWLLVVLMALSGIVFAEGTGAAPDAYNGGDAVRTLTDLYFAIPSGERQMLLRVPTGGGDAICVDRGDSIEDLIPYGSGLVYLKTENGSAAIMSFDGTSVSTVYAFGTSTASALSYYGGKFLALIEGQLHSIDPSTQLCLRLSGTAMMDYVLGGGNAYFLSVGDRMEYNATLEGGETISTQAGCVYSMDLNSGETTLLLKSGGRDLKISNNNLYFHNLADAYAMRTLDSAQLMGRVYGLDVQLRTLDGQCTEPDSGFWPLDRGLVVWYSGALNMQTEAGALALYNPANGATVVSDGEYLYVWESGKQTLTQVQSNASQTVIYNGDLAQATDLSLMTAAAASAQPVATAGVDLDPNSNSSWFDNYMDNSNSAANGSTGAWAGATPIGGPTATPSPALVPVVGSTASSSSGGASAVSSSGGTTASGGSYNVSIDYIKITGKTVNVRSGAGTSYAVRGVVSKGQILQCTGKAAKDNGGNTWYQVMYNGAKAWVSAGYAKKTSGPDLSYTGPESSMNGTTVVVTGGSVNVRAKACMNGADLGVVKKGAKLTFLGKKSTDARGIDWYKVSYNGKTGWISSVYSYVTGSGSSSGSGSGSYKESEASGSYRTTIDVNFRKGPGLSYDKLEVVKQGTTIKVTAKAKDDRGVVWYKTTVNGKTGWISSANLEKVSSSGGSSGETSASGTLYTTGTVNIRDKASLSGNELGHIPAGTALTVDKKKADDRGVTWYHTEYNGTKGWVSGKYLSKNKPSSSGGSSGSSGSGSSGSGTSVVSTGKLSIRSAPDKDADNIVGYMASGKTAAYLGESKTDGRGVVWYKINYNDTIGWVSSKYAKLK